MKILWKRGEIAPMEQFLLFSTIFCYLLLYFNVKTWTSFSLRDKQLFESEVEIKRVHCTYVSVAFGGRLINQTAHPLLTKHFINAVIAS